MTTMKKRIYAIKNKETAETRLVLAITASQAVRHIVDGEYEIKPCSAVDVAHHMAEGVKLEEAGADQLPLPIDAEKAAA